MSLNEFNNINENEFYVCPDDYDNLSSDLEDLSKCNPLLTKSLIAGSTLAAATIISPTVRKITVPTCKFIAKQQLKLLAGVGVLSIATYIASQYNDIN